MKKFLPLLLTFLLVYTLSSYSQGFKFGLKGGLSLATILPSNDDYELDNVGFTGGFHFGVYGGSRKLGSSELVDWGFEAELLYSDQGFSVTDMDTRQRFNTLIVPLLFNLTYQKKFDMQMGLQPGFLLGAKVVFVNTSVENKDEFNSTDLSLVFGLGYHPDPFRIGARINLALTGIEKTKSLPGTTLNNVVIHIYIAHTFGIKADSTDQ